MGEKNDTAWLKTKDLMQNTCTIQVKNNTSKMAVPPSKGIELVEIAEDGFTMKLPRTSCAVGHLLLIHIFKKNDCPLKIIPPIPSTSLELVVTAKVKDIEPFNPDTNVVSVVLYQADMKRWLDFLRLQSNRQSEIDSIVSSIKD